MKPVLLLAGVVALGFSGPGPTKPGMGHGNGHVFAFDGQSHGHADVHAFGPTGYGVPAVVRRVLRQKGRSLHAARTGQEIGIGSKVPMGYDLLTYSSPRARSGRNTASASGAVMSTTAEPSTKSVREPGQSPGWSKPDSPVLSGLKNLTGG